MTLVLVAHGTRSPAGQAQVHDLADRVSRRRPGLDVRLSYVDVQEPRIGTVAARLRGPAVVVPLLLTAGYHARVDIASAVAGVDAVVTRPLGVTERRMVDVLAARVAAAGPADAVVLAAAGSSDPGSRADVAAVARALRAACAGSRAQLRGPGLPVQVEIGYAATSEPRVADVVARLRAAGARRVTVAAYLLVDGLFHRSLRQAGADAVTEPLITAPEIEDIVLDRYDRRADRGLEAA